MAGSMYYLGTGPVPQNPGAKGTGHSVGPLISSTKVAHPPSPVDKIMACEKEREDEVFPSQCQRSRSRGLSVQHVRFRPDMPTRASQLAVVGQPSPVDDSVFAIASPGDVSPFSMDASPTSFTAKSASLQAPKANRTGRLVGQINPVVGSIRQLTPRQPKPGRPSLTVRIPQTTAEAPVQLYPSASSGSDCSPEPATMTSLDTPAHARRLSAQGSTKTTKNNLCDELASLPFSDSGDMSPSATGKLR
ncbi:MAG: hypothetical protein Q9226_006241 [Calogaya cf. arnoldii]